MSDVQRVPIELYRSYIASGAWDLKRFERMGLDHYCCQICYSTHNERRVQTGGKMKSVGLAVHHLRYENLGMESMADLVTLCDECHAWLHWLLLVLGNCDPLPTEEWWTYWGRLWERPGVREVLPAYLRGGTDRDSWQDSLEWVKTEEEMGIVKI